MASCFPDSPPAVPEHVLKQIIVAMIGAAEDSADLSRSLAANLQLAGYVAMPLADGTSLHAWLAEHEADVLVLDLPGKDGRPIAACLSKPKPRTTNASLHAHWRIDASRLELMPPDGHPIRLSHNESCILLAAASAKGQLVSRKALIESMGQNFLHYDERRLETLISRLRRKLASRNQYDFPVRAAKGQGYLFGVALQVEAAGG